MHERTHIIKISYMQTSLGELILGSINEKLCLSDWNNRTKRTSIDKRITTLLRAHYVETPSSITNIAQKQIQEYLQGGRSSFDLPLASPGTQLQQLVWNEIIKIPYGTTISYKELAARTGHPTAIRAVASCVGANALSLIIPCHRIIGSNGSLGGYAGGKETKKRLLELEGSLPHSQN